MSTTNYDAFDLRAITTGGQINEAVLQRIMDASPIDTPFMSSIGKSSVDNSQFSWTLDRLLAPITSGQVIDGAAAGANAAKSGIRIWGATEIRQADVIVSTRAQAVNTIGFAKSLVYQIQQRGKEMKRNVEATLLSNNPGAAGTSSAAGTSPGLVASLTPFTLVPGAPGSAATWATANSNVISAGSVASTGGGYQGATGTPPLPVSRVFTTTVAAGIAEIDIRTVAAQLYVNGYDPSKLMARPAVIATISAYMFTSSARIATQLTDQGAKARKAIGATNEFLMDFGTTLTFVANRQQQVSYIGGGAGTTPCDTAFIYDPSACDMVELTPMRSIEQPITGLQYMQELQWDYGLRLLDPHGVGAVVDVLATAAMTAT